MLQVTQEPKVNLNNDGVSVHSFLKTDLYKLKPDKLFNSLNLSYMTDD